MHIYEPTPVLNTPRFDEVFGKDFLPVDALGLLREVEFIALPNTKFTLEKEYGHILQVSTDAYPVDYPLFIDRRFTSPFSFSNQIPSTQKILESMESKVGLPYIWGGNYTSGIEKMLTFYPPKFSLGKVDKSIWTFKGCDCSGLLYEATNGFVPRNVSWIINHGKGIMDLRNFRPLDAFVWPHHIVFVLDPQRTIESKYEKGGVVITDLKDRLQEIFEERKCFLREPRLCTQNNGFVIRRLIPVIVT